MKKISLLLLIVYPVLATLVSFYFQVNAFTSIVLFLIIPSVYLTLIDRFRNTLKALVFSLVGPIPFVIIFDYIAHVNNQWLIPYSILNYRLFGVVTLEVLLWTFSLSYFMVMFYEYFLDKKDRIIIWGKRMTKFTLLFISLFVAFLLVYYINPSLLIFPYAYFYIGIIFILIPIIIELLRKPQFAYRYFYIFIFFLYYTLFYEISALKLGWWSFPSEKFIGFVTLFGTTFPFEEFFFWLVLLSMACISYYEFFSDNDA